MSQPDCSPNSPTIECPPRSVLLEILQGQAETDWEHRYSAHIESCEVCAQRLEDLAAQISDPWIQSQQTEISLLDYSSEFPCRDVVQEISRGNLHSRREHRPARTQIGKYRLLHVIGEGGMGVVHQAVNEETNQTVALKLLGAYLPHDPTILKRFRREGRALRKLQHPHLATALDMGVVDETPFLVMEFITGINLAALLKRHGPLQPAEALEILRQTVLGLRHAWGQGIIHRDVKPSNLMLTRDASGQGLVKILDLGLVRLLEQARGPDESSLSSTGQIVGTRAYMSPEQALDSHNVDHRADIYSLGVTLFELLRGKLAPRSVLPQHLNFPEPVESLLQSMLETDRTRRLSDVDELLNAIAPLSQGNEIGKLLFASQE